MYYERYLTIHAKRDAAHYKATAALREVNRQVASRGGAPVATKPTTGKFLTLNVGKGVTMKLFRIPAGEFMMGSPQTEKDRSISEGPQHKVTISKPFYMGITEVTQEQYEAVMEQYGAVVEKDPSKFRGSKLPVETVSWNDAAAFCKALSKKTNKAVRLPTEAEWEYACRAGTRTRFHFGDDEGKLGGYSWHRNNSEGKTHLVAQKKPNPWGLYDMYGNVYEWCSDWYSKDYHTGATAIDPQGPSSGTARVFRSASWQVGPGRHRSASRGSRTPHTRAEYIGFRVVVSL